MISNLKFDKNTFIWLFYIPLIYKNEKDFKKAIKLVNQHKIKSICSFKEAETHPHSCWYMKNHKPKQFIKNDLCRRQDFIKAYSHHHYICGFDVDIIKKLNNELIYKNTYPLILNRETSKKLIEVDTPEEYKKFKKLRNSIK